MRTFIYSFHMPFFFFVSGMLHKSKKNVEWKKYIRTLIIPALSFIFIMWAVSSPLFYYSIWNFEERYHQLTPNNLLAVQYFLGEQSVKGILGGGLSPNNPCWFLFALFFCKICTDLQHINSKKMALILMCLYFSLIPFHKNIFCLGNAMMAMPFFLFGHYYKKEITQAIEYKTIYYKVSIAMLLWGFTILIVCLNGKVSMWGLSYGHRLPLPTSFILFHLNAFSGSFALLLSAALFTKTSATVTSLANSLITMLGLQMFFIYFVKYQTPSLTTIGAGFLMSFVILVCCHITHCIFLRICPFVVGK